MHLSACELVKALQIWDQHCVDRADVNVALKSGKWKTNEYEYLIGTRRGYFRSVLCVVCFCIVRSSNDSEIDRAHSSLI